MTIIWGVDFATKYMCSEIASYKAYGVMCIGIIFFIIGISLYVAIRDVVIHRKKIAMLYWEEFLT